MPEPTVIVWMKENAVTHVPWDKCGRVMPWVTCRLLQKEITNDTTPFCIHQSQLAR